MNPLYNIWDYEYIQRQAQQQYHQNQIIHITDSAKKLKDFLDSVDHVDPAYQGALTTECCAVLIEYARRHNLI